MGFFFSSSKDNEDIDFGFCDMCDAEGASNDELLAMAKREGIDLRKYRK